MSVVVFQIKKGAPNTFSLNQKGVMAKKPETGDLKYINYFKGQDSIFEEDINNKDIKPEKVPSFELNQSRNRTELRFDSSDKQLYNYLISRPGYNTVYELYSQEIESQRILSKADSVEKALEYIKEGDEVRLRALGLSILGIETYNQSVTIIKANLKETAISKPKKIIDSREDPLFENKFIASLAICSGIVKTNATMTAIVWGDNNGRIMGIATGEDYITKLAKTISTDNSEGKALLQELGTRLELNKKEKHIRKGESDEIAKLKALLEESEMNRQIAENKLAKSPTEEKTMNDMLVEELQNQYKELTGNEAPTRYKNDTNWLQKKIDEKLIE